MQAYTLSSQHKTLEILYLFMSETLTGTKYFSTYTFELVWFVYTVGLLCSALHPRRDIPLSQEEVISY